MWANVDGDPYGNRTHDSAVKGRCLNLLTNGPDMVAAVGFEPTTPWVWTKCSSQLSYAAISLPPGASQLSDMLYYIRWNAFCQYFFWKFLKNLIFFFILLLNPFHTAIYWQFPCPVLQYFYTYVRWTIYEIFRNTASYFKKMENNRCRRLVRYHEKPFRSRGRLKASLRYKYFRGSYL